MDDIQTAHELAHGISLAVDVVRMLRGLVKVGYGLEQKNCIEYLWLGLKRGIALAARALNARCAAANRSVADMIKKTSANWTKHRVPYRNGAHF